MDNQQVIDLFISRGLVDNYLAQDMLNSIEVNGNSIAETLADFDVISHKDDVWPVIASEMGAEMVDLEGFEPPEELLAQ
jgi:type IV pilus assembly protein PilB